ncbi:galactose oxidase [Neoconidiobolus thromboides FSU 785]|nr:galactose oxidase [Neoconidiobolus thromboides FSU 785]
MSSNSKGFPLIARSKSIQSDLNSKSPTLNFFRIKRSGKSEQPMVTSKSINTSLHLDTTEELNRYIATPKSNLTLDTPSIIHRKSSISDQLEGETEKSNINSPQLSLRLQSLDLQMPNNESEANNSNIETKNKSSNSRFSVDGKINLSNTKSFGNGLVQIGIKNPNRKSLNGDLVKPDSASSILSPISNGSPQVQDIPPAPAPAMYWRKIPGHGDRPIKPLRAHSTTLVGDQIYLFGGCNARSCYNDVYVFDTDTMYWSRPQIAGTPPSPRRAHSATLVDKTKVFVFGGGNGSNYYNDLHILDTATTVATSTWYSPPTHGEVPSPRRAHTACYYNNSLYIFGGGDGLYPLNDVYRLDLSNPNNYMWSKIEVSGKAPPPRGYHTSTLVSNCIIVYGGSDGTDCFEDLYMFDIEKRHWVELLIRSRLPRLAHTATLVGPYFYVLGGRNNRSYSNELMILNLQKGTWETRKVYGTFPNPRGYHTTILHDARLFVFGGYDGVKFFGDMHVLDLSASAYLTQMDNIKILT